MGTVCSVIPASHYESDGADTLAFEYGFRCQTAVTLALLRAARHGKP